MTDIRTPREMIEALVAIPTVSRDSNLDCINFIRDYLAGFGVEVEPREMAQVLRQLRMLGHRDVGVVLRHARSRASASRISCRPRWSTKAPMDRRTSS